VEAGIDPLEAINKGFVIGANQVGEQFSSGIAFLPELVMARMRSARYRRCMQRLYRRG
jgi:methanogenic corrinoid protein MtbC1